MKTYKEFISESYKNAIGSDPMKDKYADQVWDILQSSYKSIGGIKGEGFSSKEDMKTIPFWKMAIKDGKVEAVIMYKDSGGRKSVAVGSTGSPYSKTRIVDMMRNEIGRSYGEKSKASLGAFLKLYPEKVILAHIKKPNEVAAFTNKKITAITDVDEKDWPKDAKLTLQKYPYLKEYGYLRDIGGKPMFKVFLGTVGKSIK